jgi:hypothetical protein
VPKPTTLCYHVPFSVVKRKRTRTNVRTQKTVLKTWFLEEPLHARKFHKKFIKVFFICFSVGTEDAIFFFFLDGLGSIACSLSEL